MTSRVQSATFPTPPDPAKARPPLPHWKRLLFGAVAAVAILLALEVLLALAGFDPDRSATDPYVGFAASAPHFIRTVEDASPVIRTARSRQQTMNLQSFAPQKDAGTYRIFCVGGSTTYGRPFFDHTSFAGWLRALLPEADPSRRWEVINAGAVSYASYRVANVMRELASHQPDLFVVYVGHNEFLERRTYEDILDTPAPLRNLAAWLRRTHLGTALHAALAPVTEPDSPEPVLSDEVTAIPIDAVGPDAYTRDDRYHREVNQHFRRTLQRMVDLAREAGAEVLFVTPASNLLDFRPFKSELEAGLSAAERDRWKHARDRGVRSMQQEHWEPALSAFHEAQAIDGRHAELLYRIGQVQYRLGRFDEARKALIAAKEEDICPLRALAETVATVRGVARERGVHLVDFEQVVAARAPHGIPGEESFVDHVHPRIELNRLLAIEIIRELAEAGIAHPRADWVGPGVHAVTAAVLAGIDRERHAEELQRLSVMLDWLDQYPQSLRRAQEALELSPQNHDVQLWLGRLLTRHDRASEALQHLQEAVRLAPESAPARYHLAMALRAVGRRDAATDSLEACLRLDPDFAGAHTALAAALVEKGDHRAAIAHLEEAVRIRPDLPAARSNLGNLLLETGHFDEAAGQFRAALELDERHIPAHRGLAAVFERAAEWDRALMHLERAAELSPEDPDLPERISLLRTIAGNAPRGEGAGRDDSP